METATGRSIARSFLKSAPKFLASILISAVVAGCGGKDSRPPDADNDMVADAQDCAPTDAGKWQLLAYNSIDQDGDGFRVNATGQLCAGASLPPSHSATPVAANSIDCDDSNATHWQLLPYAAVDADFDGVSVASAGQACSGAILIAGYSAVAPQVDDCDDASATTWRLMMIYSDGDGDGVGAGVGHTACVGTSAPASFSLYGYDPRDNPIDPTAAAVSNIDLPSSLLITP
jgi:hypothetical protein